MSKDVNNIGNRASVQKAVQDLDLDYRQNKIAFALQVAKLNTHRVRCPAEMRERFEQLFDLCMQTGNLPSYEGLAVACGIPLRTFYDMKSGNYERYVDYSQIINEFKAVIAFAESSMAVDGKIPASVWQFRAKNYLRNERFGTSGGNFKPVGGYTKRCKWNFGRIARSTSNRSRKSRVKRVNFLNFCKKKRKKFLKNVDKKAKKV